MKKKTKEIIETTTLAVGVILLSAAAFYSSKETGKTELKTDRKEQITSEQETKEAYEAKGAILLVQRCRLQELF